MHTITVYGIANCDIIKKTLDWYKQQHITVHFHDYKKHGVQKELLSQWCSELGWEILLNKKSTTWRSLPAKQQQRITNEKEAIELMMEYNSIIKRPVVAINDRLIVGFDKMYFTNQ